MPNFIDLTGKRFGRLVVVSRAKNSNAGRTRWHCVCDCGVEKEVDGVHLVSGATTSCGCLGKEIHKKLKTTHGMSKTSTYGVWHDMVRRCTNPNRSCYKNYGDRGITVCEHWKKFENFYADMGEKPEGLTLERKDNNEGYSPENCYWATTREQSRNTRRTIMVKYQGKKQCISDWAEELGINHNTLGWRLKHYPPQLAFNM